jgi:hypothetical protein
MPCNTCFEDWICKCVPYGSDITIHSPLPLGSYVAVLTDHFGNKYSTDFTVYDIGSFSISTADFPDGFFSEHCGMKKLEVMQAGGCTPVKIPILSEYECIDIEVKGGTMDKSTIGCPLP